MRLHSSIRLLISMLLIVVLSVDIYAQDEKPKVALVLSGGGAKGIAHIPLLQTLDSLGIVPDIVIGTSMGSIVGGLYSMGYSGDSIAVIAETANWDELLGGDVYLSDVTVEEKSEFKKHLVDFDLIQGKPKVKSALLKDQKLREFITMLSYPVFKITDFDELPIPYRAMTTDIVNGKEYLFTEGSISLAMRASMSIPGVFEPVEYDNTLLVDGGVLNNFPVNEAKKWGADIIIGSDVGGGMQSKDKLDNIASLLFQTGMLTSNLKNPEHREMCDILVDHMPNLTYTTGDFTKAVEILDQGEQGVQTQIEALAALADRLKQYKQRDHKLPEVDDKVIIDSISIQGVSEANYELVKARIDLNTGEAYDPHDVVKGIERGMGTNLFSQITYHRIPDDSIKGLQINGFEHSKHQIKGSLHFDSFRSVGILVNYTGRNLIGKGSRFVVSLDIAVQPRFRVQYQKTFGPDKKWWWRSEVLGEFLDQKFFLKGELAEDMKSRYVNFDNQFNKNINSLNSFAGLDLSYEYTNIVPEVDPSIKPNLLNLKRYEMDNLEVGLQFSFSDMNRAFYPTRGMTIWISGYRSLYNEVSIEYAEEDLVDVQGSVQGFSKLNLEAEKRYAFSKSLTGIVAVQGNFTFLDKVGSDQLLYSDFGHAAKFSLGGVLPAPKRGRYTLPGLHEDELYVTQMMRMSLAAQWSPVSKLYITPHFDMLTVGFEGFDRYIEEAFSPAGNWSEQTDPSALITAGATLAYHSFLGPVTFDLSWANDIDKFRLFFGLGLQLNP